MDKASFFSRFFALVLDSIAMAFVSWLIILVWTLFAASAAQTDSGFWMYYKAWWAWPRALLFCSFNFSISAISGARTVSRWA